MQTIKPTPDILLNHRNLESVVQEDSTLVFHGVSGMKYKVHYPSKDCATEELKKIQNLIEYGF